MYLLCVVVFRFEVSLSDEKKMREKAQPQIPHMGNPWLGKKADKAGGVS